VITSAILNETNYMCNICAEVILHTTWKGRGALDERHGVLNATRVIEQSVDRSSGDNGAYPHLDCETSDSIELWEGVFGHVPSWFLHRPRHAASATSGEADGVLDMGENLGATLLRRFEKNACLFLITRDIVAFEQHSLYRIINARRFAKKLMGGRVGRNATPQLFVVLRGELNEYLHGAASPNRIFRIEPNQKAGDESIALGMELLLRAE
jgi:hypothetical protein